MTALERAARAAYERYGFTSLWDADAEHPNLRSAQHDTKELFRSVARAVLMAVRDAGAPDVGYFETIKDVHRVKPGAAWSDMIDAILNEKDTTND